MIRRPPRSTLDRSSAASDVYKRQAWLLEPILRFSPSPEALKLKLLPPPTLIPAAALRARSCIRASATLVRDSNPHTPIRSLAAGSSTHFPPAPRTFPLTTAFNHTQGSLAPSSTSSIT